MTKKILIKENLNIIPLLIIVFTMILWNHNIISIDLSANIILLMGMIYIALILIPEISIQKINYNKRITVGLFLLFDFLTLYFVIIKNHYSKVFGILAFALFYYLIKTKDDENEQ